MYSRGSCANLSKATDEELDAILISIYEQFPSFGRRMIDGYLMALGERVPRRRIEQSYLRVNGPPVNKFGNRRIQRRMYSVQGQMHYGTMTVNMVCQLYLYYFDLILIFKIQGLMRWKIVIHASVDGFSRFLLGIQQVPTIALQLLSTYLRILQRNLVFRAASVVIMVPRICLLLPLWKTSKE